MEEAELGRTIEAILLVAVEPLAPQLLAELLEEPVERVDEAIDRLARAYEAEGRGLRGGPHRRRGALPDPPRPGALRGALRQPRRLAPALDGRARDPGHRGLPPACLAGPDLVPARRQRGRRDPPARAARLHRRGRPRRTAPASPLSSAPPTSSSSASASTRWTSCPRWRTSYPGPRWRPTSSASCSPPSGWASRRPPTTPEEEGERLQKVLARAGFGSRRACEELIAAGRVRVDGAVAVLGHRVDVATARVEVDGSLVPVAPDLVYYLLNKPDDVITTADDPQGRPTVMSLVPDRAAGLRRRAAGPAHRGPARS